MSRTSRNALRGMLGVAATIIIATIIVLILTPPVVPNVSGVDRASLRDPDVVKTFFDRLQFLWERYLDMVQLIITLLTGAIAVSAGIVRIGKREPVIDRESYALGMASLLVALTCAVLLRLVSQVLMEIEVFGDPSRTQALFEAAGLPHPFTRSYTLAAHIRLYGGLSNILVVLTALGFLVGLGFLTTFAFRNLPQTDATRSSDAPQSAPGAPDA